jgi:hypothetical protein
MAQREGGMGALRRACSGQWPELEEVHIKRLQTRGNGPLLQAVLEKKGPPGFDEVALAATGETALGA